MKTKTRWKKVKRPQPWRAEPGEELIGTYSHSLQKDGEWGIYQVHFVKTRTETYYVSGTIANSLFTMLAPGTKIKLVFKGRKPCQGMVDLTYKTYELFTEV